MKLPFEWNRGQLIAIVAALVVVALVGTGIWSRVAYARSADGTWGALVKALEKGDDAAAYGTLSDSVRSSMFDNEPTGAAKTLREALGSTDTFDRRKVSDHEIWMMRDPGDRVELRESAGRWSVARLVYVKHEQRPEDYTEQPMEFKTSSLPKGTRLTVAAAVKGDQTVSYDIRYVNGSEESRTQTDSMLNEPGEPAQVWVGTGAKNASSRKISALRTGPSVKHYQVPKDRSVLYAKDGHVCVSMKVSGSGGKKLAVVLLRPDGYEWKGDPGTVENTEWYWNFETDSWTPGRWVAVVTVDGRAVKWKPFTVK